MNQEMLNTLCMQLVLDCPVLDDWLLWYYLTKYENLVFETKWQHDCGRTIIECESKMLNKLNKKQRDRKSMPKFLFNKIYNKPIPDEILIESEKWRT